MSASFLLTEIEKADLQITRLQNTINDLTVQQTAAQKTISDYEQKSSIARFFIGKSMISQAQTTLDRVRIDLPKAKDDLRRQQDLKYEFSLQLESLLLLQEQIRAVIPSKNSKILE